MSSSSPRYQTSARLRARVPSHGFHVVLVEPEIPPNTGNVARLCAATRSHLHLVHPLGFLVDEKAVRRAGLDYWHLVDVTEHEDWQSFERTCLGSEAARAFFFTGKASRSYLEVDYRPGDCLVFGCESRGLPEKILRAHQDSLVGIPTIGHVRSLNLANAVSLGVYEALRQSGVLHQARLMDQETST